MLGVTVAAYLSWVALNEHVEPFCSGLGDCHTVQSSEFAKVAGIPVAVLGLGMYLGLGVLLGSRRAWRARGHAEEPRTLVVWTFALALSGALYSAYLTYIELFEVEAICAWCVASAVIVSLILLLSLPDLLRGRPADEAADGSPQGVNV